MIIHKRDYMHCQKVLNGASHNEKCDKSHTVMFCNLMILMGLLEEYSSMCVCTCALEIYLFIDNG